MTAKTLLFTCLLFCLGPVSKAQNKDHKARILFIGNSYTYVNDLPALTAAVARSAGDTLQYDSYTVGGYTLRQHAADANALGKIAQGNWDYVVLQEQSQYPSFPIGQVEAEVFPYAHHLDSLVHQSGACARTIFYMTWGRKNGDAGNCPTWPPVCTYRGMDSLIALRYAMMADSNHALLSPVGAVWSYLRSQNPGIELYQSDESHPSPAGSYAAACCFYTTIFKKSPLNITHNASLSAADAASIRNAVKVVVYDSLSKWHIGQYDAQADFNYTLSGHEASFSNHSANADQYVWYFGDGQSSTDAQPVHTYTQNQVFEVKLVAMHCGRTDTMTRTINLAPAGLNTQADLTDGFKLHPNPVKDILIIQSELFIHHSFDIRLINTAGQVIKNPVSGHTAIQHIDLSGIPGGVYFLQISENGQLRCYSRVVKM